RRRHTRFSRDWSSDVCSSDLSGGDGGRVVVWDAARGTRRHLLQASSVVRATAFVQGGALLATAGDDGAIQIWDLATGGLARTLGGHQAPVLELRTDGAGRRLLSAGQDG